MVEKGKVVFVGDLGVGKTSIIRRKTQHGAVCATIMNVDPTPCVVDCPGDRVALNIFDTAGSEEFRTLVPIFARGSHVGVVVYDLSEKQSFDHVKKWIGFLREHSAVRHIVVVGNKADLHTKITDEEETELGTATGSKVIRTSAHSGMGIDALLTTIAEHVTDDGDLIEPSTTISHEVKKEKGECGC
jgi:Ras-related protein Rab-6A